MTVQQLLVGPNHFLSWPRSDFFGLNGTQLSFVPALVDLLRSAHQADGIDLGRRGQRSYRHRHRILLAFCINDLFKQKSFALLFVQPTKLPPNQWHQFSIFIDPSTDSNQFFSILKFLQMGAEVAVVFLARHGTSLECASDMYRRTRVACQACWKSVTNAQ